MIPRLGEPVKRNQPYHLRPGAYAVLWRDGRLLLTHQADPTPEYQLPGGGIDPGESPLPALRREVFEETGWHMAEPRWYAAYRRFVFMPEYDRWAEKLCHIFIARPTLQIGPPTEPGHRAEWMPVRRALSELGNPVDRHVIARLMRE